MGAWSTSAAHEARDGHRQPSRAKDDSARRPIEAEANRLVETYADTILRVSYTYLRSTQDAEDICQTVLIKLVEEGRRFPDLGQERAWVVRLSVNACKNWKKSAWFRRRAPLEEGLHLAAEVPEPEDGALLALEARRPAPRRQIPLRRARGWCWDW